MAANSQPAAAGPPKRSSATSGNSARGIASTIAAMSTAKDIISTGCRRMKARPATTDRSPGRVTLAERQDRRQPEGGVERGGEQRRVDPVGQRVAAAGQHHAGEQRARRTDAEVRWTPGCWPPAPGRAGTIRGTTAPRVGEAKAKPTDCSATRPSRTQRCSSPRRAWASSPNV